MMLSFAAAAVNVTYTQKKQQLRCHTYMDSNDGNIESALYMYTSN